MLTGLTFAAALGVVLVAVPAALVGVALLFVINLALEKLFALRKQRVFRRGLLTNLTHLLVNNSLVALALIALFQHANVRLRFPVVRWVINTPEWHHWHHSLDEARDKNFGLPVIDKVFGTVYMPRDRRPNGFGTTEPVPAEGHGGQLAYPFTAQGPGVVVS